MNFALLQPADSTEPPVLLLFARAHSAGGLVIRQYAQPGGSGFLRCSPVVAQGTQQLRWAAGYGRWASLRASPADGGAAGFTALNSYAGIVTPNAGQPQPDRDTDFCRCPPATSQPGRSLAARESCSTGM